MSYEILTGDCIESMRQLPSSIVQTCVTSPPYYGLRDYGVDGQIGLEESPEAFVAKLVDVFREVRRLLKDDGTCWINLGDSYSGSGKGWGGGSISEARNQCEIIGNDKGSFVPAGTKPKDLIGIPWMVAFALRADGWYLRSDIIWHKPNPMPESVTDRPTKAHEYIFLLSKSREYFYDIDAVREEQKGSSLERLKRGWNGDGQRGYPGGVQNHLKDYMGKTDEEIAALPGRNKRSVWTVATRPYADAHFATYPPDLIEPCILAGSAVGDTVLDPFNGAATTGIVALKHGRKYIGCELNPAYVELSHRRIERSQPMLLQVTA